MFAYRTNLKEKRFLLRKTRKWNLLTDINLYKNESLSSKHLLTPLTSSNIRPKTRFKVRRKLKLKARRKVLGLFKHLQTLRAYRKSFSLRRTQYRVNQNQVSRTLRPYRYFYRYGELTLPNLEQISSEELPFMGLSEARTSESARLTSFWHKHFPHVLQVRGPQWTNVLVKRMRWYRISPDTQLTFNLTTAPKKFFQKKVLFSNRMETAPLDDDSTLKYTSTKPVRRGTLVWQSSSYYTYLVYMASFCYTHQTPATYYTTWNSPSEFYFQSVLRCVVGQATTLRGSIAQVTSLFTNFTSSFTRTFTQESLLLQPNFFNRNRLSLGLNSFSNPPIIGKKPTLRPFKKRRVVRRTVWVNGVWARRVTSLIFNKYYNFIVMSKIRGQEVIKRPLYSHFFNSVDLFKRSLITIVGEFGSLQLRKMILNSKNLSPQISKGLPSTFNFQCNDNIIESSADNNLTTYWMRRSKHSLSRAYIGVFTRISSTSKDFWDAVNLPVSLLETHNLNPLVTTLTGEPEVGNPLNLLLYSGGNSSYSQPSFISNPTLFKFMFWNLSSLSRNTNVFASSLAIDKSLLSNSRYSFSARNSLLAKSNLWPLKTFNYTIRRKVVKMVINTRYLPRTTNYFYKTLISFIEYYTGKKVYLKFNPFIENSLTYSDLARCYMWYNRVLGFQKLLGHRIFVHESLRIFHLAIRFRDPTFLANWIKAMLYRMSFWKYRILFRYIKYVFRSLFWSHFENLDFKGVRLMLRGKISVAGNARARSLSYSIGHTGHAEMNNRVLSHFTTVHSFTGVMGFRLTFYF